MSSAKQTDTSSTPSATETDAQQTSSSTQTQGQPERTRNNAHVQPSLSVSEDDTDLEVELNHWDGNLPQPEGHIAPVLANQSIRTQQLATRDVHEHIRDGTWTLASLQESNQPHTFIIGLPLAYRKVRVIYGLGTIDRNDERFQESPAAGRALALYGEKWPHTEVVALTLPPSLLELQSVQFIDEDKMEKERLRTDPTKKERRYFGMRNAAKDLAALPMAVPIPPYLVYDFIDADMDVVVLYERVLQAWGRQECLCRQALGWALQFLRAAITDTPATHNSIYLPDHVFGARNHIDVSKWRDERFAQIFPTLVPNEEANLQRIPVTPQRQQPASQEAPPPANVPPRVPPIQPQGNHILLTDEQFFRFMERMSNTPQRQVPGNVSTDSATATTASSSTEEQEETLGMHELVYNKLLKLCGLTVSEKDDLPLIWSQLRSKSLTKTDKNDLIRATLGGKLKYRGRRIPFLPSIITMIRDRSFEGEVGGSASAATKGLSPFALPRLTEAEIEMHTEHDRALNEASSTSVSDVTATKIKATAPESFTNCIYQLQTFGNLLEKIFGELCPLLLALDTVIEELENFTDTERATYSKQSYASILWIIKEQARSFTSGNMIGPNEVQPAFQLMLNNIQTRIPIVHGGVPTELYLAAKGSQNGSGNHGAGTGGGGRPKRELNQDGGGAGPDQHKKRKTAAGAFLRPYEVERGDVFHKDMKKAMDKFLTADPRPSIKQICAVAGCTQRQLFPENESLCLRSQLFGLCDKKCKHVHTKASDAAIAHAIEVLKPAFEAPAKVLKASKV